MRVAVYRPTQIPESFHVYYKGLLPHLHKKIELVEFTDTSQLPADCALIWDIRSGGGHPPLPSLLRSKVPMVVTVHGVAPLALPVWKYCYGVREMYSVALSNRKKRTAWKQLIATHHVPTVIAVSEYGKSSIHEYLGVPESSIDVCHHGVDHELYNNLELSEGRNYFLHISNGEKRKNISRVISAYRALDQSIEKKLILRVPPHVKDRFGPVDGVQYCTDRLNNEQIRDLYRGACAFIFPSLYEGFGLPVLEAMACGTPVVTGRKTACAEIGGDAAVLVQAESIEEIALAMNRLLKDEAYYSDCCAKALSQASLYSWAKSAEKHIEVFTSAVASSEGARSVFPNA